MERFRLRARQAPKKGLIWELKLFPDNPRHIFREADGRVLGEVASPESVLWLRRIAEPFLARAEQPVEADQFGPDAEPRWLLHDDGMRMALAFSAARWLPRAVQRRRFRDGLAELPSEVVLYWFTLCYYGYHPAAGRAALRTLLAYEEAEFEEGFEPRPKRAARTHLEPQGPSLFDTPPIESDLGEERTGEPEAEEAAPKAEPPAAPAELPEPAPAKAATPRKRSLAAAKKPKPYKTRKPVKPRRKE
jgi:hypothetical protein